jgi:hypothetical protein
MTAPRSERRSVASRAMRPVARAVSTVLEPAFYWLGLLDPQGHPANAKIAYVFGLVLGGWLCFDVGQRITGKDGSGVTWEYVALVTVWLAYCLGPVVFFKFLRLRSPFGGNGVPAPPPEPPAP